MMLHILIQFAIDWTSDIDREYKIKSKTSFKELKAWLKCSSVLSVFAVLDRKSPFPLSGSAPNLDWTSGSSDDVRFQGVI